MPCRNLTHCGQHLGRLRDPGEADSKLASLVTQGVATGTQGKTADPAEFDRQMVQLLQKMDAVTYRGPRVIRAINRNYIPVRADEADYPALAKHYRDYGWPMTVILDGNGTEIHKRVGYLRPQWMLWLLRAVAANPSPAAHR